jgi:hypothetical protein
MANYCPGKSIINTFWLIKKRDTITQGQVRNTTRALIWLFFLYSFMIVLGIRDDATDFYKNGQSIFFTSTFR